jgi:hypothetical protein
MYLAATLLIFGVHSLNASYNHSHHCLLADRSCKLLVIHTRDMKICVAATNYGIGRWGAIAKGFCETANLNPPVQ